MKELCFINIIGDMSIRSSSRGMSWFFENLGSDILSRFIRPLKWKQNVKIDISFKKYFK